MSLFNPWVLLFLIGMMATSFFSGYKVRGDAEKAKQLETALAYAELVRNEQDRVTQVSTDAERDLEKVRKSAKQREARLREELKHASYSTCIVPESGRMLYNAAVRDARSVASGQPEQPVHDAGATPPAGNDGRPVESRK